MSWYRKRHIFNYRTTRRCSGEYFNWANFYGKRQHFVLHWHFEIALQKKGKKVCKTTAVQCYQCFSLHSLLFLANRAKWFIPNKKSYSGELLTAPDRCIKVKYLKCTLIQLSLDIKSSFLSPSNKKYIIHFVPCGETRSNDKPTTF